MEFKGWSRTSLIDFPQHIATVLFTGGCNFRCPPCHNADLVLRPQELPDLPEETVWAFLERRRGKIDGLVLTGGEPTIHPQLPSFLRRVRARGLAIKLDTNGYRPDVLQDLLQEGLLDFVALDVKANPPRYADLSGVADLNLDRIARSISLLQQSDVAHEFRTTVVPGLLQEQEIEAIARWIEGAARYVLQQFRPQHTLDPLLSQARPYPESRLRAMAQRAGRWVEAVHLRGA